MFGAEGGRGRGPHVTDHLLRLDGDLLVTEQVGLHLPRILGRPGDNHINHQPPLYSAPLVLSLNSQLMQTHFP